MSQLLRPRSLARVLPSLLGAVLLLSAGCIVRVGPPVPAPTTPAGPNEGVPPNKDAGQGKEPAPSSPLPPVTLSTGKRFALLVGVKDYDSKDLPDLSFPDADVEELADTLIADGYPAENIVVMTKARSDKGNDKSLSPTSANIREQLDRLLGRCGKDDVVFVGLTGHGIQCKEHKQYFCGYQAVLTEAEDDQQEPKTLIAIEEVYQKLGGCPAGLKLLVVDACRNDPFAKGGGRKEVDDLKSVTLGPLQAGVIALYSCSEGEHSYEAPELQHGVFFNYLIKGLKGDADMHQDGRITWTELADYLVSNVDRYTASRLRLRQHPHVKGESNADEPLAIRPAGRPTPTDKAPEPGMLLSEDFRSVPLGGPPRGWDGDGFSVVKDADGRACLEVNRKEGEQKIELPRLAITGDFYVEVETLLDGSKFGDIGDIDHNLRIELEGKSGAVLIPVVVNHLGWVTLQNGQAVKVENFTPYKRARVRLTREGNKLSLALNGEVRTGMPLDYTGVFDTVRLGLTAGNRGGVIGTTAKIYSVKIGLPGDGPVPPPPPPLPDGVREDFSKTPPGSLPEGWSGSALRNLSVQQSGEHRDLELNNPAGGGDLVVLPPKNLNGNFYIEFTAEYPSEDTTVALRLTGGAKVIPLVLTLDGHGTLSAIGKPAPSFQGKGKGNVLGVERGDRGYVIKLNGVAVAAPPLAAAPEPYDSVGLLVGVKDKNQSSPRITAVRVQPLGP